MTSCYQYQVNSLKPNDPYSGRTAPLTSKGCMLYIYSTNTVTEYFKHGIYSPFFPLQNAICFIILTYLVPVLYTFYVQDVLKLKKNNSGAKRLIIDNITGTLHLKNAFLYALQTETFNSPVCRSISSQVVERPYYNCIS